MADFETCRVAGADRFRQATNKLLTALALTLRAEDYASKIAPLIDPAKLATLGERAATPSMW